MALLGIKYHQTNDVNSNALITFTFKQVILTTVGKITLFAAILILRFISKMIFKISSVIRINVRRMVNGEDLKKLIYSALQIVSTFLDTLNTWSHKETLLQILKITLDTNEEAYAFTDFQFEDLSPLGINTRANLSLFQGDIIMNDGPSPRNIKKDLLQRWPG